MIKDFIALLFPSYCFVCNTGLIKEETYLCSSCRHQLPRTNTHEIENHPLTQRLRGLANFEHIFAYLKFLKEGKTQKIIHKLKYDNCPEVGTMLGQWYGAILRDSGFSQSFDLIVPVPLHQSKFRQRGYNQSDFFAQGLSNALEIAWESKALTRNVKNQSQTRKGRMERFDNVSGIFESNDSILLENKRILLVDDVITTGATLLAASYPLINAGSKTISIAALTITQ